MYEQNHIQLAYSSPEEQTDYSYTVSMGETTMIGEINNNL